MRSTRFWLVLIVSCVGSHALAFAPPTAEEVLAAEAQRRAATTGVDEAALRSILHPTLRYVHSTGTLDTRDDYLALLRARTVRYVAIRPAELEVRVFGAAGIVTGAQVLEILFEGKEIESRSRFTAVYHRGDDGALRLVSYQSTALSEPADE